MINPKISSKTKQYMKIIKALEPVQLRDSAGRKRMARWTYMATKPRRDDPKYRRDDPKYRRKFVDHTTQEAPGTIIVHTLDHWFHFTLDGGKAICLAAQSGVTTLVGRHTPKWAGRRGLATLALD
jgi:hypothetical protein